MRTSTAIRIKTYKGAYAGSVMARKRKIQRIKSAFISAVKLTFAIMTLSAIVVGAYEGYRYVVSSPYFNISEISLEGNINLKRDDILSLCGIKSGQGIFSTDIDDIYKRLKGHPWIRDAVVKKELPDRLSIKINERKPAAVLKSSGFYLMDSEGVILTELTPPSSPPLTSPFSPHSEGGERGGLKRGEWGGLPVILEPAASAYKEGGIVNSEEVLMSIDIVNKINNAGVALSGLPLKDEILKVEPININRVKLYLRDREGYIIVNSENMDKNFKNLQTVMRLLNDENNPVSKRGELGYIDISYRDKVIVKYSKQ